MGLVDDSLFRSFGQRSNNVATEEGVATACFRCSLVSFLFHFYFIFISCFARVDPCLKQAKKKLKSFGNTFFLEIEKRQLRVQPIEWLTLDFSKLRDTCMSH